MTQALEFLYFVTTKEITFAKLGVCCESAMIGEFHPHASDSGGGACPSVDASRGADSRRRLPTASAIGRLLVDKSMSADRSVWAS
jgi:hypothetical protein